MRHMEGFPKTVFITGSSAGFGAFMAHAFARAGYVVVLHGRNEGRLRVVKRQIMREKKIECPVVVADLQTQEGVGIIKEALRDHGVDIVINNAAVNPELGAKGVVSDMKEIEKVLLINTSSAIALCYAAFEYFKTTSKNGTIANINSVAGLRGSSREAIYAVSKFGLRGFSQNRLKKIG